MQTNEFEKAFSDFLERKEYDEASNALFSIVRTAFLAGWKAAGGNAYEPQNIVYLLCKADPSAELHSSGLDPQTFSG